MKRQPTASSRLIQKASGSVSWAVWCIIIGLGLYFSAAPQLGFPELMWVAIPTLCLSPLFVVKAVTEYFFAMAAMSKEAKELKKSLAS